MIGKYYTQKAIRDSMKTARTQRIGETYISKCCSAITGIFKKETPYVYQSISDFDRLLAENNAVLDRLEQVIEKRRKPYEISAFPEMKLQDSNLRSSGYLKRNKPQAD